MTTLTIFAAITLFLMTYAHSLGLYLNTFGHKDNQAIIFIHGGPGYNSLDFEITTAEALSKLGFFVVVYDQRGQGRSAKYYSSYDKNELTFKTYAEDIKDIMDYLRITEPILIGHSFGGSIGLSFLDLYPKLAKKLLLISSPINYPDTMRSVLEKCAEKFPGDFSYISNVYHTGFLQTSYNFTAQFVSSVFWIARKCDIYLPTHITEENRQLRLLIKDIATNTSADAFATTSFVNNENYAARKWYRQLNKYKDDVFGIYGTDDGLFDNLHLMTIQSSLDKNHFEIVGNASHTIYIDQQPLFLDFVKKASEY